MLVCSCRTVMMSFASSYRNVRANAAGGRAVLVALGWTALEADA
jgi:hypothetical protein